jgi:hypothetical protein
MSKVPNLEIINGKLLLDGKEILLNDHIIGYELLSPNGGIPSELVVRYFVNLSSSR